ncbi:lytic murein transglycosylase B [Hydromonas duriensis]|uniref:Membrane-bound lytic murein transglycosylase B n=1 Tax=Hydromonas duriensis TaxID=1527608 RepID=A0A4R6Y6G1_9BURK|nr:lytic murein transglycosylase B [Hydromonas duriensis]TDR31001.1 membrane-bound lytic murein transglycosylase B [Hydromonas duriensis]
MNPILKKISAALAATMLFAGCATAQNTNNTSSATSPQVQVPNLNNYAERSDVKEFVKMMSDKYGYSQEKLLITFSNAEKMDTVLSQLEKDKPNPNFKKNWETYRKRYIEPIRIKAGVDFWNKNEATLARAAKQYGVPEYILVGIIGVETIYGRYMGDTNVFDVLTTVSFDYPRRSDEYKKFLEEYIVLAITNKMPLRSVKGSYAGAIGIPQFMPDSWRDYGVDFDGDGKVDLRNSTADAIGSVANFLKQKGGWIPGQDVVYAVKFDGDSPKIKDLLAQPIEPSLTIKQIKEFGVSSPENIRSDIKLSLIDLPNGDKPTSYLLGSRNFYAITRYNKSYMYAMSVYDLGSEVAKARLK